MDILAYIKSSISKDKIIALLEDNGAQHLTFNGDQIRCTCPIHHGDNASAFVYDMKNNLWFCFTGACGGGDIFDLVRELYGIVSFKDAVSKCAELFSVDIEDMQVTEHHESGRKEIQKWIMYMRNKTQQKNKGYEINRLGSFQEIGNYKGLSQNTIRNFGIVYSDTYNRVAYPLKNSAGVTVGVTMRRIDETETIKWLHRPKDINTGEILYNLNNIKDSDFPNVLVTEGTFDVVNLYNIGIENAVACFGAHLTANQEELLLKNFFTVVLAYDNDPAGKEATRKAIVQLKNKTNLYVLDLGLYKDTGEIKTREEFDGLKKMLWFEWEG